MRFNMILAGVGGQGILTIAYAIAEAAMRRGYHVKQSEVHGMAQRGGAVEAHLRFSDKPLHSSLVPIGKADLVLAVEPVEALRYVSYLREHGTIVSSCTPVVNIPDYPQVEEILEQISNWANHILVDAVGRAKQSGSARAENMVMLGAASTCLDFTPAEVEAVVSEMFQRKGENVVRTNRRAFQIGRAAATAYRDGLRRGATARQVRDWLRNVPADELEPTIRDAIGLTAKVEAGLSASEHSAVEQLIERVTECDRKQLFEHEVYQLLDIVGAINPPKHLFVDRGGSIDVDQLAEFDGDEVMLKVVSPKVVHKTEAGGVRRVRKSVDAVRQEMDQLTKSMQAADCPVHGFLVVEFVHEAGRGLGGELFVGVRATREFGPVIAAGFGGVDTEFLAATMKPGVAVAKALVSEVTPESFFELFTRTAAYRVLSGSARGHRRVVSDGELIRCFRSFISLAKALCDPKYGDHALIELEVNPFAFRREYMVPLDGRGRIGELPVVPGTRPVKQISSLLEPESIAIAGVSGKRLNFGRIILDNVRKCGFDPERLFVIKDGQDALDGVPCVASVADLPHRVDLVVAAVAGQDAAALVAEVARHDKADAVILIPGGLGETEGTEDVAEIIRNAVRERRAVDGHGPIVLGGNCMGVRSRPGMYDTFFIPDHKMDPRRDVPPKRSAIISQSGAFIITRLSNLERLDPTFAVSVGNQLDLTVSDMLLSLAERTDIDCVGVYVEGFNDHDGLSFVHAVQAAQNAGKVVVFYKAGRTRVGRDATKGHTASIAGDYDVCQSAVANAGAIVCDTFKEFEQVLELATHLHEKEVRGCRIGAISNAGYEAVGMADNLVGSKYRLHMPALAESTRVRLDAVLQENKLDRLIGARNPLDLTPMATDAAYEQCVRIMMEAEEIDAVIVGCVPMTPAMLTTASEIGKVDSIANRIPRVFDEYIKPLVFVVDASETYDALASKVREAGVPVFRSADQAMRSVGRYLCDRMAAKPSDLSPAPSASIEVVEEAAIA